MKRIVNIYNFVRAIEPRSERITPEVLLETTAKQIGQVAALELPATFALQYDALIDPRYQKLIKDELPANCEVAAWWEITQPHALKAGLEWRGRFPWDWHAHVGFATGYTPAEREKLVDVYMQDFKSIFGSYPLTAGSWFIDAHTLSYMADKYDLVASCNCKDQVGTDGYTLWGGYWNQAYYPSRKNAYMPAQDSDAQIPMPVFRMLGSDPIYQYDDNIGSDHQHVVSLEPVYGKSGADPDWVNWFLDLTADGPCLAFAYAQAGQENSFTWDRFKDGLTYQVNRLAQMAADGRISIETLAESGKWYRSQFEVTPATAVTALEDWKGEGRGTVWYNSRFYRANMLWQNGAFRIRDIHMFDQEYASPYLDQPLRQSSCNYTTLPIMDGFHWSTIDDHAGVSVVEKTPDGVRPMTFGAPEVVEQDASTLRITCAAQGVGALQIVCREDAMTFTLQPTSDAPKWALHFHTSADRQPPVVGIEDTAVTYRYEGYEYRMRCRHAGVEPCGDAGTRQFLIVPEGDTVALEFGNAKPG
jgi:hypothetical protein